MESAMTQRARKLLETLVALAFLSAHGDAFAQGWPSKPIRWIVPYTPGGYTDYMTRTVMQKLSEVIG